MIEPAGAQRLKSSPAVADADGDAEDIAEFAITDRPKLDLRWRITGSDSVLCMDAGQGKNNQIGRASCRERVSSCGCSPSASRAWRI